MIGVLFVGLVTGVTGMSALFVAARRLITTREPRPPLLVLGLVGCVLTYVGVELVGMWA